MCRPTIYAVKEHDLADGTFAGSSASLVMSRRDCRVGPQMLGPGVRSRVVGTFSVQTLYWVSTVSTLQMCTIVEAFFKSTTQALWTSSTVAPGRSSGALCLSLGCELLASFLPEASPYLQLIFHRCLSMGYHSSRLEKTILMELGKWKKFLVMEIPSNLNQPLIHVWKIPLCHCFHFKLPHCFLF